MARARCAYSGGVDSAVVAKAAYEALGDKAVAITGAKRQPGRGGAQQAEEIAGSSAFGIR